QRGLGRARRGKEGARETSGETLRLWGGVPRWCPRYGDAVPVPRCPACLRHKPLPEPFPDLTLGVPLGWGGGRERRGTPQTCFAGRRDNGHLSRAHSGRTPCAVSMWSPRGRCAGWDERAEWDDDLAGRG